MNYNEEVRKAGKDGCRHGDVYIIRISEDELPEGLKKKANSVLADGEVTGHQHVALGKDVAVLEQEGTDDLIMQVFGDDVQVVHPEHAQVTGFSEGYYKVFIQEEHDPYEGVMRRVAD